MAMKRFPRGDQHIYDALATMFRRGEIYAFSFECNRWVTWWSQKDFDATVRYNVERDRKLARDEKARKEGHGPFDWTDREWLLKWLRIEDAPPPRKLPKAELVKGLRALRDQLPVEAIALLDAA